jgi:hypothetical protein
MKKSVAILVLSLFPLIGESKEEKKSTKVDTIKKYKIKDKKVRIEIGKKRYEYKIDDILKEKIYTKRVTASKFGIGYKIKLEKHLPKKKLTPPPPLITKLPAKMKRKVEKLAKDIKVKQQKIALEKIEEDTSQEVTKSLFIDTKIKVKPKPVKLFEEGEIVEGEEIKKEKKMPSKVKQKAAEVLAKVGEKSGVKALEELALSAEDLEVKLNAIRSLGEIKGVKAIPTLKKLMDEEERKVSKEAAFALARLGVEKGLKVLKELVNSKSVRERVEASLVLAETGDKSGIEVFKKELYHEEGEIRWRCAKGLGLIGGEDVVPLLLNLVKEDVSLKVQIVASEAILKIKERSKK